MVAKFDHVRPSDMDIFLQAVDMSEEKLLEMVEPMRDPSIWEKDEKGNWYTTDSVVNHIHDEGVEQVRIRNKENFRPVPVTRERISSHCQQLNEQTDYIIL